MVSSQPIRLQSTILLIFIPFFCIAQQIIAPGDTLFLNPKDEFLDIRLSKFSAVRVGNDHHFRTLVYYNEKPFTGTIVKNKGLRMSSPSNIIGDFNQYEDDDSDSTYFAINYFNGRFCNEYFFSNEYVEISLWFDKNGNPDKSGYTAIKKPKSKGGPQVPEIIPPHIGISDRFINEDFVIDMYDDQNLGIFNHRGNTERAPIFPAGYESIESLIQKYSMHNPSYFDCNLIDTIFFNFSHNKLLMLSYKDDCETDITFNDSKFLNEMPVFDAAVLDGNRFLHVDYSSLLFSQITNALSANLYFYIDNWLGSGEGYYYSTLENIPESATVKSSGYLLEIKFDKLKIKKEAIIKQFNDVFYENGYTGPYREPVYYLKHSVKSFKLRCDVKDDWGNTIHIHTDYSISNDRKYQLFSEYQYDGDTVSISSSGDLSNGVLDNFKYKSIITSTYHVGVHELNIQHNIDNSYVVVASGTLGYDHQQDSEIVAARIEARKSEHSTYNTLSLVPNGLTTFMYADGTQRQYKYKLGAVVID